MKKRNTYRSWKLAAIKTTFSFGAFTWKVIAMIHALMTLWTRIVCTKINLVPEFRIASASFLVQPVSNETKKQIQTEIEIYKKKQICKLNWTDQCCWVCFVLLHFLCVFDFNLCTTSLSSYMFGILKRHQFSGKTNTKTKFNNINIMK